MDPPSSKSSNLDYISGRCSDPSKVIFDVDFVDFLQNTSILW